MWLSGSADCGQRMKQRGTSFKEARTGERNRREGRKRGGKADEMEREIRKEDLDRERGARRGDEE